ncbi:MAG: hypothetical protein E7197_09755 [Anaerovibrio sp.]|uniref:PcfJ domain-containing protein n=1 Tax=Anaerovibrio sp. TaxID=1872532 RepID=UPI0025BD4A7C|nr:PcfJ domain-containing protein [Anaerovibrio sp.]MBE6100323.1 hypothetical protein [Anaerovibrio sp.]
MQYIYVYDCKTGTWRESQEDWVKDDIEKIPVALVFAGSNQADIDRLLSESDSRTLFAYSDNDIRLPFRQRENYGKYAVARWRIQLSEKQQTAIIIADVYTVDYRMLALRKRSYKQLSLRLDYGRWKYSAIPTDEVTVWYKGNNYTDKWDWLDDIGSYNNKYNVYPHLPDVVGNRVMEFLKKLAKKEFGFVPTVPKNMPMNRLLRYFVQFPLDVNVGWYIDLFGYDFKQKVHRNNDSNFELVCDYLNLPAVKSLKKAYHNNGRIMLLCYFLARIGLRDVNAWQQFYDLTEIMGVDIGRLGLDRYGEIYNKSGCGRYGRCDVWWGYDEYGWKFKNERESFFEGWHLLANWLLDRWGTKRASEIIYQVLTGMNHMVRDALNGWKREFLAENIDDNLSQAIYQHGFTEETHDILFPHNPGEYANNSICTEEYFKRMMATEFKLTSKELSRVEETMDGTFDIAHTGAELKTIGALFHNCVFGYTEKMDQKRCTIYFLTKQGKALACIEVCGKNIVQAFGPCNRRLEKDVLTAVLGWAARHQLDMSGGWCM